MKSDRVCHAFIIQKNKETKEQRNTGTLEQWNSGTKRQRIISLERVESFVDYSPLIIQPIRISIREMSNITPLINRVTNYVKALLLCVKNIPDTHVNKLIIEQLLRASTSIGANYHEALEAESRKDFIHKMGICKKEARETMYWIDLLTSQNPAFKTELEKLQSEVHEFLLIFAKSQMTARNKLN